MLDDESEKAKGYLYLHSVCAPVNGKLGVDSALRGSFFGSVI